MIKKTKSERKLRWLPVSSLQPNPHNPNRMTAKNFNAYVREAERLGNLPKPTIVRSLEDKKFGIVDGEHGWRAAKQLGFEKILCEIVQADDFEAMRQCFLRNRGGSDDPVLLGRMFQEMMDQGAPSRRQLAKMINLSEASVRNYLAYAEAAKLRSECAPQSADKEIARLKNKDVQRYLKLEASERDVWLDQKLNGKDRQQTEAKPSLQDLGEEEVLNQLVTRVAKAARGLRDDDESFEAYVRRELDTLPWPTVFLLASILPGVSMKEAVRCWLNRLDQEASELQEEAEQISS